MKKSDKKKEKTSASIRGVFNYRVIRIDENGKKVTMVKFHAPDDKGALAYLADYKRAANRAYTYYWDYCSTVKMLSEDGKTEQTYESFEEAMLVRRGSWLSRAWDNISWYAFGWWICKLDDLRWWLADMLYFAEHKQYRRASWSLDTYILETLKHNVNVLLKTKHGISPIFIDEARKTLHKDDKSFDLKKYNNEHYEVTPEEEKLALEIQNTEYKQLVGTIDRYMYYYDCGCTDDKALDKELKSTLPIKQGSYDALDYGKLYAMQQKQWYKIWEWMKLRGQTLWD